MPYRKVQCVICGRWLEAHGEPADILTRHRRLRCPGPPPPLPDGLDADTDRAD